MILTPLAGAPPAEARILEDRAADRRKAAQHAAPGPVLAVVSLAKQRLWVYGSTGLIAQSAVSTGRAGYATPTGVFSIVQKKRFHRSNIYSDAPMPYMQRITWSGIALHAGVVPGHPASHGCIRLPHPFAVELWGMTRIGARVVIVPNDALVRDIAHRRLPVPTLTPAPPVAALAGPEGTAHAERPADRLAGIVDVAHTRGADEARDLNEAPSLSGRLLNPLERAKLARQQAMANAASTAAAAKAAAATSAARVTEANAAIAALRSAELSLASIRAKRDAAAKAMDEAAAAGGAERAKELLREADTRLAEAQAIAVQAGAVEAVKTPEAIAAAKAAWSAEQAGREAAATLKATERSTEPISIFVSRKAGRIFIRQAWAPIHEAPVTFKEADTPLGTHAYLAVAPDTGGRTLRWLTVSLPPSRPAQPRQGARHNVHAPSPPPSATAAGQPSETADSVLERFELTEETKAFIEDRLWTGAFLIVSDEGISPETGTTTDFIVVTR